MSTLTGFIVWNASPEVFHGLIDGGNFLGNLRWYGLLFASGFIIGQYLMAKFFKAEGKPAADVDAITFYMVVGTILGARLGHCLFYQPDYYLSRPLEILKVWEGGLASHGATIGILVAVWLYSRNRVGQSYLWVLDRIVITVALGGAFIRIGNFVNSEIIGKPTNLPWAVIFSAPVKNALETELANKQVTVNIESTGKDTVINGQAVEGLQLTFAAPVESQSPAGLKNLVLNDGLYIINAVNQEDRNLYLPPNPSVQILPANSTAVEARLLLWGVPRHPAQLYEALSCLVVFILFFRRWLQKQGNLKEGELFGFFLVIVFGLRFFYEMLKENQVAFENDQLLNMGQLLSIPLVLVGLWLSILRKTGSSAE